MFKSHPDPLFPPGSLIEWRTSFKDDLPIHRKFRIYDSSIKIKSYLDFLQQVEVHYKSVPQHTPMLVLNTFIDQSTSSNEIVLFLFEDAKCISSVDLFKYWTPRLNGEKTEEENNK